MLSLLERVDLTENLSQPAAQEGRREKCDPEGQPLDPSLRLAASPKPHFLLHTQVASLTQSYSGVFSGGVMMQLFHFSWQGRCVFPTIKYLLAVAMLISPIRILCFTSTDHTLCPLP